MTIFDIQFCNDYDCFNDFYNYVNKKWIDNTLIPEDQQKWGSFQILQQNTNEKINKLIQNINQNDNKYYNIKILYDKIINANERFNPLHLNKINEIIMTIQKCKSTKELFDFIMELSFTYKIKSPVGLTIQSNLVDSNNVILFIESDGLELPDRDYYLESDKQEILNKYKEFMHKYSKLFGHNINVDNVLDLETELAKKTMTKVEARNPDNLHNIIKYEQFIAKYPNLNFILKLFIKANKKPDNINYCNKEYFNMLNSLINTVELNKWIDYFIYKTILLFPFCITQEIYDTYFDFFDKTLIGTKKQLPNWKMAINIVNENIGELLGFLYVANYFNKKSLNTIKNMVLLIKDEFKNTIIQNEWMDEETKLKALSKLNKMNFKIGYPEKMNKDYSLLKLHRNNSLLDNLLLCKQFNINKSLKKLYEPLDRDEWHMYPHQVNAYYSPTLNEIVFPAGILQSPFFDPDQPMGVNFGGIGSVIGHEITHGFDDQGSKFDSDGNLKNWWSSNDLQKYKNLTNKIREQYSSFIIEGQKVNGSLTLGENIADIGGISISLKAYKKYLSDNKITKIYIPDYSFSGIVNTFKEFCPIQTFFISYANIWKAKTRKEDVLHRLLTDPHSPGVFRVNGVVRNIDDFYNVFSHSNKSILYLDKKDRVIIW